MKTPTIRAAFLLAALTACSRDEGRAPENASGASAAGVGLATVPAKPEMLPPEKRRVIELEGGVRVEVLAEGQGSIVGPGDEVALSMTLSYVPLPPKPVALEAKAEGADDAKPAKSKSKSKKDADEKSDDAKQDSAKSEENADAKPAEVAGEAAVVATEPVADAKTEPKAEESAKPEADAKSSEPAKSETDAAKVEVTATKPAEPAADASGLSDETIGLEDVPADASKAPADSAAQAEPFKDETAGLQDEVGTAPAPAPLDAPLEPVIVLSTKSSGTPIRGRVGVDGGLIPGLSRALVGLRAGTIAEITLSPEAAYGVDGLPAAGIPAGTSLTARIEIREVRR